MNCRYFNMAADWLREILVSVQLEQFYLKFKEDDISLPSHFDHVTPGYLTKKGLSGPAQKRLLDAVKKYKKKEKKYNKKVFTFVKRILDPKYFFSMVQSLHRTTTQSFNPHRVV